jgi:hypothetical protein
MAYVFWSPSANSGTKNGRTSVSTETAPFLFSIKKILIKVG